MAGKNKDNPRYEIVSFRTTRESKERLNEARANMTLSCFVDMLLSLYLQKDETCRTT